MQKLYEKYNGYLIEDIPTFDGWIWDMLRSGVYKKMS